MSLTLWTNGNPISGPENNNNLTYLEGLGLTANGQTLEDILSNGNTSGTFSIEMSDGARIDAVNGGGQLDLRYDGTDNQVMLSTDAGAYTNESLYMEPGYIELGSINGGMSLYGYNYNNGIELNSNGSLAIYSVDDGLEIASTPGGFGVLAKLDILHNDNINIESANININNNITNTTTTIGGETIIVDGKTLIVSGGTSITLSTVTALLPDIPTYVDNAAAVSGGLAVDTMYKTASGELRIVV